MECWDSDPEALVLYMVESLNKNGILFCHAVEPRMCIVDGRCQSSNGLLSMRTGRLLRGPSLLPVDTTERKGSKMVGDGYTDIVAYGRLFISNPEEI